jgi:putative oxidoreductase
MPTDLLLLLARLLIAALFIPAGFETLGDIDGSTAYFAGLGMPLPSIAAWAVGFFELAAGAVVLAGLQTRLVALALAAFALAAGFIGHYGQGADDPAMAFLHRQMLMKDIAIAGGLLALAVIGAGRYSLDALWQGKDSRP